MKTFTYEYPRYLNTLVTHIEGKNCKLSATLMPDIPEFIDAALRINFFNKSAGLINYDNLKRYEHVDNVVHTLLMLRLCEKHNIMPFWCFTFDNNPSQWREPTIKYVGYNFGVSIHDEPYHTCVHPLFFIQQRKWYMMKFENYQGEESVNAAKNAIAASIEQGYVVTQLYAGLNPRIRTADHYCDYEEYDAQLWAGNGSVEMSNIPDGFQLPKYPRILDRAKNLLEDCVDTFLETCRKKFLEDKRKA
ncbi:hypothetical protein J4456_02780 [Candidatus Pacearchaeota archaeon]|nr:hypothetical protein [Candidatus Pacearchaeota archaeon]